MRFTCEICGVQAAGVPLRVRRRTQVPLELAKTYPVDEWVCFHSVVCASDRCREIAYQGGIPGRIYREFGDDDQHRR